MLTIDPNGRPSVKVIIAKLESLGQQMGIDLASAAFPPQQGTVSPLPGEFDK